ncbi:MAG: lysoplasmalogenase [Candidatus Merdivicinus sp.]|jgi:uncharacterized membrane protein YhhN
MISYLLIAAYLLLVILHLFLCLRPGQRRLLDGTKVMLMPVLLASVLSTGFCPPIVAAALLSGWLGDVLLLRPDQKPFFLGGLAAFLIGHLCYIPALMQLGEYQPAFSIPLAVVLLILGTAAYFSLHTHLPAGMRGPVIAYLLVILGMAYTAFHTRDLILASGAVLFVLSDYTLARSLFIRRAKYSGFIIMLTYLVAQFLLAWGLCQL